MIQDMTGMFTKIQTQSKLFINGRLAQTKKGVLPFNQAKRLYSQLQGLSGSETVPKEIRSNLAKLGAKLSTSALEEPLIKLFGARKIESGGGGFQADFKIQDQATGKFKETEIKNIKAEALGFDEVSGFTGLTQETVSPISLGGGKGVTIRAGSKQLITGFDQDIGEYKKEEIDVSPFYRALDRAYKKGANQADIVKALEMNDPSAQAYKASLTSKASDIIVPVTVSNRTIVRSLQFTYADMKRYALGGKGSKGKGGGFKLKPGKDGSYLLNFSFTKSTVITALNDMSKGIVREFNEGVIGQKFVDALAVTIAGIDPKTLNDMRKHLEKAGFTIALEYLSGSLMVASGALIRSSQKRQKNTKQRYISQVQLSNLIQERLARTMDRAGTPNPPDLKYRSGRFASTVRAIPNYRKSIITYFLNPIYTSLESYGYNPGRQVEVATREVVQSLFKQRFKILRGN